MKQITKITVAWDGLLANLCRAIDEWNPQNFQREKDYRDSLAGHLTNCAPDARIECEYRHLGTTIDIYVEWDGFVGTDHVLIELKRNLIRKQEFNRLVGQIYDMKPGENDIIIVLCGATTPHWLNRLKAAYKDFYPSILLKPSIAIVSKESDTSDTVFIGNAVN